MTTQRDKDTARFRAENPRRAPSTATFYADGAAYARKEVAAELRRALGSADAYREAYIAVQTLLTKLEAP